ncbi:MAG TPA: hypothetical protein VG389_00655 [Myxococcota bacterium]|jgi:hypothetical protein|nr:hypothetical protein [Myxococcota bacterium]
MRRRAPVPVSVFVLSLALALAVAPGCGGHRGTDAAPPGDAGTDAGGNVVVDGPVDLTGTFIAVGRISVLVTTLPTSSLIPTQVLDTLQVTLTDYAQTGTTLTANTTLCNVVLPKPRIIDANNPSSAQIGVRFGDALRAYLDAGNISITSMGPFLSGTEISGGVPLDYMGSRDVFVLGASFDPGVDAETAALPVINVATDGTGNEIVTITEPAGTHWEDTEGDVCPGLVVDMMSAGDPCPGVTVTCDGSGCTNPAVTSLLPSSEQVAFRAAFTLRGSVYSSNSLGGEVYNPVNTQELLGFTLEPAQTLSAQTVVDNIPRIEVCSGQPECVAAAATSTWLAVRVDGTNGSLNADADASGAVSCSEALLFLDDNPELFGIAGN